MLDTDERITRLDQQVHDLRYAWDNLDPEKAMVALCYISEHISEIVVAVVEQGVQAGMTQRGMAELLNIPPSALRGARQEFSRS